MSLFHIGGRGGRCGIFQKRNIFTGEKESLIFCPVGDKECIKNQSYEKKQFFSLDELDKFFGGLSLKNKINK